jgi:hypothetical protein
MMEVENDRKGHECDWQSNFARMLPGIEQRLRRAFRHLDGASQEEAVGEGVAHSVLNYLRLYERSRAEVATPSTLAFYSARQVKRGRPAVGRMKKHEVLSRYGHLGHHIEVERLPGNWFDEMVADQRASVGDQVAAKLDVSAWFATLSQRMKQIATDLALGFSTSEVARKHDVTAGRISQLRRKLEASWAAFEQEAAPHWAGSGLPTAH